MLAATPGALSVGMGHTEVPLTFRNISGSTCRLSGYPAVAALDGSGQVAAHASPVASGYSGGLAAGSTPPVIDLAPGQQATAQIEDTDNPTGNATTCPSYAALLVTPPGQSDAMRVDLVAAISDCSGLEVNPLIAGTTGRS